MKVFKSVFKMVIWSTLDPRVFFGHGRNYTGIPWQNSQLLIWIYYSHFACLSLLLQCEICNLSGWEPGENITFANAKSLGWAKSSIPLCPNWAAWWEVVWSVDHLNGKFQWIIFDGNQNCSKQTYLINLKHFYWSDVRWETSATNPPKNGDH